MLRDDGDLRSALIEPHTLLRRPDMRRGGPRIRLTSRRLVAASRVPTAAARCGERTDGRGAPDSALGEGAHDRREGGSVQNRIPISGMMLRCH
jgi:hypothetical protein